MQSWHKLLDGEPASDLAHHLIDERMIEMNATDKGREHGFAERLKYIRVSKATFQCIGEHTAKQVYKLPEKQSEYLAGWMENYHEPHPAECACSTCEFVRSEIQTF